MIIIKLEKSKFKNIKLILSKFKIVNFKESNDGYIYLQCFHRNKDIDLTKINLLNDIPLYFYENTVNSLREIFYTPFLFNFKYISNQDFPLDDFINLIPIESSKYLLFSYDLNPSTPQINDIVYVTVHFKFTFNSFTKEGLIFKPETANFWNNSTTDITITKFGRIPMSRQGSQFKDINNLTIASNDSPSFLTNTSFFKCFYNDTDNNNLYINNSITVWDTSDVIDMRYMFYRANNFNCDIGNWTTSNVSFMDNMFYGCTSFNQNIGNWNTSKVESMSSMFYGCTSFNQNIGNWNTSNVKSMDYMFSECKNFNQNLNNWDFSHVKIIKYIFNNATNFNNGDSTHFNVIFNGDLSSLEGFFFGCKNFNKEINNNGSFWDTSNITNMSKLFSGAISFDSPISKWNTTKVTNMSSMFNNASSFNQTISYDSSNDYWNTNNVVNMSFMFFNASKFNSYIGNWNISNVTEINNMFNLATSFNNGDTTNAYSKPLNFIFNQNLTNIDYLFSGALNFNQSVSYNVNNNYWNTSNIISMNFCFYNTTLFKNGNDLIDSVPMNWILNNNLSRADGAISGDPNYLFAPLYFSVDNELLTSVISPFKGTNYQGNPSIPNIDYSDFGKNWNLIDSLVYTSINKTPYKPDWVDIVTDMCGNILAIDNYTTSSPIVGIYVSTDLGNTINKITTYLSSTNVTKNIYPNLRCCVSSKNGSIKIVIPYVTTTLSDYSVVSDFTYPLTGFYYSNDYGFTWYEKTVNASNRNFICSGINGLGNIIVMGASGVGTSCGVYISNDFGVSWSEVIISNSDLSDIVAVNVSFSGRFMTAIAAQISPTVIVYYSSDYGLTWTNIFNIPQSEVTFPTTRFRLNKILSMNDDGNKIFISSFTYFYYLYFNDNTWTINKTKLTNPSTTSGFFNVISSYTGNYILTCRNPLTQTINRNILIDNSLNSWETSDTIFPGGTFNITTDIFGKFSYVIVSNNTLNSNGEYIYNGIYRSILPNI
jgi:surface protein